jgi:hypothetical protein
MNRVHYDVTYTEPRNRVTTFFRIILAIPHFIVVGVWAIAVWVVAVVHWFVILFTGKRNAGMFRFETQWLGYAARVTNYTSLMFDEYPKFGTDASGVPMSFRLDYAAPASRLTNGLRFIWIIPAWIIGYLLLAAGEVITVAQWLIVVFTGKANDGIWGFTRRVHNYAIQLNAYALLLTDTYPKFDEPVPPPAETGTWPAPGTV